MLCASAVALALVAPAGNAWAQTASAGPDSANLDVARSVAVSGREAFNAGDYETALSLFRKAYELYPAPTVVLYEARTLEKMGRLIEAVEAYSRTTRTAVPTGAPAQFAEAIAAARTEGEELRTRIPALAIEVRGTRADDPQLSVTINGRAIGATQLAQAQSLNPGTYHIAGSVGGERETSADVTLVPGQTRRVVLNLTPRPADPLATEAAIAAPVGVEPAPRHGPPLLAYVAGGVGVAGVGAGVLAGVLANKKYDEAERACEDHRCPAGSPGLDAVDAFRTWRMVSSVSYGVGAAGIAAGVVLWLTANGDAEAGQVGTIEPWGTANTAGIRGTF
ncbi:MAG TPA: tetratricopeptide repeat protein [Polyangiaceae bacterium]|nr:tetratricopeptide repeat protein [Polyangiaceae bacterium]